MVLQWLDSFHEIFWLNRTALRLFLLLADRASVHQDERLYPTSRGIVKELHEVLADFVGQKRIVKIDFWEDAAERRTPNGEQ
jgi:hypothetical protein